MDKRIQIFNQDVQYELPELASEFMAFWQEKIDVIPEEFLSTARIELEGGEEYGCGATNAVISYVRPETAQELQNKKDEKSQQEQARTKIEIEQLKRLQAKYGVIKGDL